MGALACDADQPIVVVSKGATVDPYVGGVGFDLVVVDAVAAAGLESKKAFICAAMKPRSSRSTEPTGFTMVPCADGQGRRRRPSP